MNKGKTIFSQIMSLIPERDFKTCVDRYKGNYTRFSAKILSTGRLTGVSFFSWFLEDMSWNPKWVCRKPPCRGDFSTGAILP